MVGGRGYYRKDICIIDLGGLFFGRQDFYRSCKVFVKNRGFYTVLPLEKIPCFSVLASVSTFETIFLALLVAAIRL